MPKAKKTYKKKPQRDVYQEVTDKVVALLENKLEKRWDKPWIAIGDGTPSHNMFTKHYYRGVNQFLLALGNFTGESEYKTNRYATFNQIKQNGGTVTKGSKSTPIIYYSPIRIDEHGKYYSEERYNGMSPAQRVAIGLRKIPMVKQFNVFNVEQTEGLAPEYYALPPQQAFTEMQQDDRAEDLLKLATDKMGVKLTIKESNRAYYSPSRDEIVLPLREQFKGVAGRFYNTATHELLHSTAKRLERPIGGSFGSPEYAKEELIAELGAAFNCAALGLELDITDNAAYLQSWLGVLKADKKAIVHCAAAAQRASDFILEDTPYQLSPS